MVRACTICTHKDVDEINRRVVSGDSIAEIARNFGLSDDALRRHADKHIPKFIIASPSAKEVTEADLLLKKIEEYEGDAKRYRDMAEANGDIEIALKAVDRALKCIELSSKVRGLIQDQPQINILVNPQWVELRTVIIKALEPYPAAREAVVHAIRK